MIPIRPSLFVVLILMATYLPATSPPVAVQAFLENFVNVPLSGFNVISGHLSGSAQNISTIYQRNRAALIFPASQVLAVIVRFQIAGPTAVIATDVDGVVRQGVTIWMNYQDPCNQYFLAWRADSSKPAGTSVLGAQRVLNPGASQLSQCPGTGFTPLTQPDGSNAFRTLNIDVMDGQPHELKIVRTTEMPGTAFRLFTDGTLQMQASDLNNTFPDIGLYGLRTDNVIVTLTYVLELPPAQASAYCANPGACFP